MMGMWPGWGWLLLPVCQALVAPREVSGRVGQALTLNCWYAPGYQGYNKYWCRGASRDSCRKVVETAGREVPRQHGRVSITDNHVFCFVLLTLEELSEEDAGSYWCGVERAGRDIMTPVTIRVLPAPPRTTPDASVRAVPANPAATPSPWLSEATTTELLSTANSTNATATGPPMSARSALVPTAVLLSLLAVAGSAGLVYALRRRREDLQRPLGAVRSKPKDWVQPHHTASAQRAPPGTTSPHDPPLQLQPWGSCGCPGARLEPAGSGAGCPLTLLPVSGFWGHAAPSHRTPPDPLQACLRRGDGQRLRQRSDPDKGPRGHAAPEPAGRRAAGHRAGR
ncbi:CMRF35-like molecule 3 [Anas acuta]|uniref:CMRF35-like molecule 3 n=1 Tax=Anas acuta TaxID=28680 RepID=UPI0035C940AA